MAQRTQRKTVMPEPDRNTEAVCGLISTWLAANELNASWLAQQAGINPSILSRSLNHKTNLNEVSALRLYRVMRWRMSKADRESFLAAAGVLDLVQDAAESLLPQPAPTLNIQGDPQIMGLQLMVSGYHFLFSEAIREALAQFMQAERVFSIASGNASRAACEAIGCLINLGDITRAEQEILRVAGKYDQVMDPETRVYFYMMRGSLEFDRGRLDLAEPWFTRCLHISDATGVASFGDAAQHSLGLIYLNRAQAATNGTPINALLDTALSHFNKSYQWLQHCGALDWTIAFEFFRRAQVQQLQGEVTEAAANRRLARELFRKVSGVGGGHHIDIAEADLDLAEGNTRHAAYLAAACLEDGASIHYSAGMSRAVRVLAQAALQDGNLSEALDKVIAAACIKPFGTCIDRTQLLTLLGETTASVRRVEGERGYQQILAGIRARLNDRSGIYACLDDVTADRSDAIASLFNKLGAK
jgi:tetratricopeptide (TPR) repeat protein